jgi:hypothetical protein
MPRPRFLCDAEETVVGSNTILLSNPGIFPNFAGVGVLIQRTCRNRIQIIDFSWKKIYSTTDGQLSTVVEVVYMELHVRFVGQWMIESIHSSSLVCTSEKGRKKKHFRDIHMYISHLKISLYVTNQSLPLLIHVPSLHLGMILPSWWLHQPQDQTWVRALPHLSRCDTPNLKVSLPLDLPLDLSFWGA